MGVWHNLTGEYAPAGARVLRAGERESAMHFTGVKVFSATKAKEREELGETVTRWLRSNDVEIVDRVVAQSSDDEFHCLTIVIFFRPREAPAPA